MFINSLVLSRPDVLCIGTLLIVGITTVLALRNLKQFLAGCITLPLAGLCGLSSYLLGRWLYDRETGILYGLAAFAISGLIVVAVLRWIASLDSY